MRYANQKGNSHANNYVNRGLLRSRSFAAFQIDWKDTQINALPNSPGVLAQVVAITAGASPVLASGYCHCTGTPLSGLVLVAARRRLARGPHGLAQRCKNGHYRSLVATACNPGPERLERKNG